MSINPNQITDPGELVVYQIRVEGQLGCQWTDWFNGLTITSHEGGDTLISGPVDQAALHGLLKKVRDLGMPLVSVNRLETDRADESDAKQSDPILMKPSISFEKGDKK